MIYRKPVNPNHHNAGRLPNFNQSLSQHLSFANFQLKGFSGHVMAAYHLIHSDMKSKHWNELPVTEQHRIIDFCKRLRNFGVEAEDLAADIAEYNRDKTKLVLPKIPKPTLRSMK